MRSKKEKILNWVCISLTVIVLVVLIFKVFVPHSFLSKYRVGFVMSESMEPTIPTYSILFEKRVNDVRAIKEQDIVTFLYETQEGDTIFITHRILEVNEDSVITKGDNNPEQDPFHTSLKDVRYEVIYVFPYFVQCIIALLSLVIILYVTRTKKEENTLSEPKQPM